MAIVSTAERGASAPGRVARVAIATGRTGSLITAALASKLDTLRPAGNHAVLILSLLELQGPLRPRDVQQATRLTSGGATNQLDRLVALGLVERSHDTLGGDRRAVIIELTPEGRRVAGLIADTFAEHAGVVRQFLEELGAAMDGGALRAPAAAPQGDLRRGAAAPGPTRTQGDRTRQLEIVIGLARLGTLIGDTLAAGATPRDLVTNDAAMLLGELARGGSRRPRDLARLTGLSSGGMSKLLERLRSHGWIELRPGGTATDRRATLVLLTPRGRRRMASIAAALEAQANEIRERCDQVEALLDG